MRIRPGCFPFPLVRTLACSLVTLALLGCGDDEADDGEDAEVIRRDVGSAPDVGPGDVASAQDVPSAQDTSDVSETLDSMEDGANDAADTASADDSTAQADSDDGADATCGDGSRDDGEECDDGNLEPGDGCDAGCRRETSSYCAPCALNSECNGASDLCVDGACALDCSDWECPLGNVCEDVAFGAQTMRQCVPASGSCFPPEDCGNGVDDNEDGRIDCDDPECALDRRCEPDVSEDCGNGVDDDGDGLADCGDGDCADSPLCAPGAEQCTNGIDDDGDLAVDCDDADCAETAACAPAGDLCATAGTALIGTQTGSTVSGESRTETDNFCGGRGPEAAWTFVAPESRTYCADTFGSSFDTVLSVRTNCGDAASEDECNDDSGLSVQSQIQFRALAGESLTLIVDGFDGFEFGSYTLTITADVCGGTPAENCDNGRDDDGDFATDCDDTDCADAPACAPTAGACETLLPATTGTQNATVPAGDSTQQGTCGGRGPELAWSFTPPSTRDYCATTNGSGYDTVLYVRTECEASLTEIACNDDSAGAESSVTFAAVAGEPVVLFTDGFLSDSRGDATLNIVAGACPTPGVEVCDNGVDDDGDGDIDCDDFSCQGDDACPEICDNDYDDDGDFLTDCRDDDCEGSPLCVEICDDLEDNDGDFFWDCGDDDCADFPACMESDCSDGLDNDGDFLWDCGDDDCADDPACIESVCDDGLDNDDDFDTDCDDDDCLGDPACEPLPDPCTVANTASLGAQSGTFTAEDSQYGATCLFSGDGGEEQVWQFSPTSTGIYCVDTFGSGVDTVLSIRETCSDVDTELACDDDSFGSASQVEVELSAFEPVWLMVDTFSPFGAGAYTLNIALGACD